MKFTEEQVEAHKEFVSKLQDVSEYLKQNEPKYYALNNATLSQLLHPLRHALVNRIKRITEVSERLYSEVELQEEIKQIEDKPKRGRRKKTTKA